MRGLSKSLIVLGTGLGALLLHSTSARARIPDHFQCELRHIAFASQGRIEVSDSSEGTYTFNLPARTLVFKLADKQEKITKIEVSSRTDGGAKIQQLESPWQRFYVMSSRSRLYFSAVSPSGMIFTLQSGPCRRREG